VKNRREGVTALPFLLEYCMTSSVKDKFSRFYGWISSKCFSLDELDRLANAIQIRRLDLIEKEDIKMDACCGAKESYPVVVSNYVVEDLIALGN